MNHVIHNSIVNTGNSNGSEQDDKRFDEQTRPSSLAPIHFDRRSMMYENISDLLKQIDLGEDSVLELKAVEFSGN